MFRPLSVPNIPFFFFFFEILNQILSLSTEKFIYQKITKTKRFNKKLECYRFLYNLKDLNSFFLFFYFLASGRLVRLLRPWVRHGKIDQDSRTQPESELEFFQPKLKIS